MRGNWIPAGLAMVVATALGCSDSDVSRMIGARCDDSDECDDRCLAPGDDFPGGFCTLSCDSHRDCPGDARCIEEEGGVCLFECTSEASCNFLGLGWSCVERSGKPEGTVMVCRGA